MSKPTMRSHHVVTHFSEVDLDAAYYTHEEAFTVFKTTDGGIVASFHNSVLVSIVVTPDA